MAGCVEGGGTRSGVKAEREVGWDVHGDVVEDWEASMGRRALRRDMERV